MSFVQQMFLVLMLYTWYLITGRTSEKPTQIPGAPKSANLMWWFFVPKIEWQSSFFQPLLHEFCSILQNHQMFDSHFHYQSIMGKLNNLAQLMQPNILLAIHSHSRFSTRYLMELLTLASHYTLSKIRALECMQMQTFHAIGWRNMPSLIQLLLFLDLASYYLW